MSWDVEETNRKFTKYLHGEEDELSEFWEYEAPQQDKFHYAFYEVALDSEVDLETGEVRVWAIDGTPLVDPLYYR